MFKNYNLILIKNNGWGKRGGKKGEITNMIIFYIFPRKDKIKNG
jgi:hypothetical protein